MAERKIIASFKIEKGIPIPPKPLNGNAHAKVPYPFLELEIGDSFWTRAYKSGGAAGMNSHNAILARKDNRKFVSRREDKEDQKGYRIWRTA